MAYPQKLGTLTELIAKFADAISVKLEDRGVWVRRSHSPKVNSASLYLVVTQIIEGMNGTKCHILKARISDHQPENDQGPYFLCIDTGTGAYADITLDSIRSSSSGLNSVAPCVWDDAVVKAYEAIEQELERKRSATPSAKARKLGGRQALDRLEAAYAVGDRIDGAFLVWVKGGFIVDLGDAVAFLPISQADVVSSKWNQLELLRDQKFKIQPFKIIELDLRLGNIVVSRRAILEESRAEQRAEVIGNLTEGQTVEGVVKNITEYGAFVDLGGVDGLLHVTDMAWRRVSHPSEILTIGETTKVQVIKINKETHRISLGMKQLQDDPWDLVAAKYPPGSVHQGGVTNITDYGAFVELEAGVEGLVHVSEMSWTTKNVHPGKIVSTSQEVDVMVLEIDAAKRRVSLGLKQTQRNPWEVFTETHPEGTEVKNITEFGLFIGLEGDIDGMVQLSDLSWDERGEDAIQNYRKGDVVQAAVSEVDVEKERISLSIKALRVKRGGR